MAFCIWTRECVWRVTTHAQQRFCERFPGLDFRSEFFSVIKLSEIRNTHLWLSDNGVVFVIRRNAVVTVLTEKQAMENLRHQNILDRKLRRIYGN